MTAHGLAFAALAGGLVALTLALDPSLAAQAAMLAPLVAVLGLPHGALDLAIARRLWPLQGLRAHTLFALGYTGLAGLVLGAWILAPGVALVAFLGYSAWHFSDDWSEEAGRAGALVPGILVLAWPAMLRPAEVEAAFAILVPDAGAATAVLRWSGFAAVAVGLPMLGWRGRRGVLLEMALLAGLATLLSPLIYFATYFCGLHSPRHFGAVRRRMGWDLMVALRAAMMPTLMTLVAAGVAAFVLGRLDVGWADGAIRVVFIGLAALTVPHMLLVDAYLGRTDKASMA